MTGRRPAGGGKRHPGAVPHPTRRGLLAAAALPFVDALGAAPLLIPVAAQAQARPEAPAIGYRLQESPERQRLLREAEAALARGDAEAAEGALDRAALMSHSADTELALVRCYMQAGQYRRAMAFGAHAAGAHRREQPAGNALYLWLLHAGGQGAAARQMLDQELARTPDNAELLEADRQLRSPWPLARGPLLTAPLRVAPFGWGEAVPAHAAVLASGVLGGDGRQAVVPAGALPPGDGPLWLRNGLGQTVRAMPAVATAVAGAAALPPGLALLRLDRPLPPPAWRAAPREPFGGTPACAVGHAASATPEAAWPLLHQGFIGRLPARPGPRPLGIDLPPGPRGGPVFDKNGLLAGIALHDAQGRDQLLGLPAWAEPGEAGPQLAALDEVYERALTGCLQLLGVAAG